MNTTFDTLFSGERQRTRSRIFGACFGLGFLTLFFFVGIDLAHAASKPLTGWAWSENVGWVSFSSENDTDPVATGVQKSPNLFGVFIEDAANALLSGYAWSEHVGWISFNANELSGCPSGECSARSNNGVLEGWARVCAGKGDDTSNVFYPNQTTPNNSCSGVSRTDGWDGWISLKGPSHIIALNTSTGIYDGYAWGSDVVGWVDFDVKVDADTTGTLTPPPLEKDWCGTNAVEVYKKNTGGFDTWTPPANLSSATIKLWGGGGRGGKSYSVGSGGGGGGGYSEYTLTVNPALAYTLYVGRGGAGSRATITGGQSTPIEFGEYTEFDITRVGGTPPTPNGVYRAGGGASGDPAGNFTPRQGGLGATTNGGAGGQGITNAGGGGGAGAGPGGSLANQNGNGGHGGETFNGAGGVGTNGGRGGHGGGVDFSTNPDSSRYAESGQAPGGGGGGMQYSPGDGATGQLVICAPKVTLTPPVVSSALGACGGNTKVWWSEVTNATNYKLYRSSSSGTLGTEIGSFSAVKTQASPYLDSGLTPGAVYYYTVVASQGISTSQGVKSQAASATCLFKPKVELYISPSGDCGTLKSANIIKGSPAKICWTVSSVPAN